MIKIVSGWLVFMALIIVGCKPDATDVGSVEEHREDLDGPSMNDTAGSIDREDHADQVKEENSADPDNDSSIIDLLEPVITYIEKGSGDKVQEDDVVLIEYTGKIKGGRIFDSSERIGKPLGVKLGLKMVVPGWEMALKELHEGDKVIVEIPSELGYKDKGYGKIIPPGADLEIDLEVVDIVEPLEVEYGVAIHKLNETEGANPVEGNVVKIQYTAYLSSGRVFDTSNKSRGLFSFEVGKRSVMPGLQYAVLGMKEGERAIVNIPSEVGYGVKGLQDVVPPNEDLTYIVHLVEVN